MMKAPQGIPELVLKWKREGLKNEEILKRLDRECGWKISVATLKRKVAKWKGDPNSSRPQLEEQSVETEPDILGRKEKVQSQDALTWEYKGRKSITSEQEAIDFFQVNTDEWEPETMIVNSWDGHMKDKNGEPRMYTNYQVKIRFKRKAFRVDYDKILNKLRKYDRKSFQIKRRRGENVGVVCLADMHIGAKTTSKNHVIKTKNYDLETVVQSFQQVVEVVNDYNFKHVHVALLGDLIESFLGLNHINSWESMEEYMHKSNALIYAYEVIKDNLILPINNISKIHSVGGNHDRASTQNDFDVKGSIAEIISYMLKEKGMPVSFHPLLLNPVIDGIKYIWTHGHFMFAKKHLSSVVLNYGDQSRYNVLAYGHLHNRGSKKKVYQEATIEETVNLDAVNYRQITVAPVFPGNFFSESLGYSSSPGFSIMYANANKSNIHHHDVPIDVPGHSQK